MIIKKTIYEDASCIVKLLWEDGQYIASRTYFYDGEGNEKNHITVFFDGTVKEND